MIRWLIVSYACISAVFATMTVEQIADTGITFRKMCQPKFKVSDEFVENLKNKQYPDDKEVKCYVNCVFEMMRITKKGKLLYDATIKQINTVLPDHFKEPYTNALNACKETAKGVKDNCDASYALLQCFFENNPMFMFP